MRELIFAADVARPALASATSNIHCVAALTDVMDDLHMRRLCSSMVAMDVAQPAFAVHGMMYAQRLPQRCCACCCCCGGETNTADNLRRAAKQPTKDQ